MVPNPLDMIPNPLDMVPNPMGVLSRMNAGQVLDCFLGWAGLWQLVRNNGEMMAWTWPAP